MKSVKLLVTLAALAGATVNATSVTFTPADTGSSGTPYNSPLTFGSGAVRVSGFYWDDAATPEQWATSRLAFDANGVGVARAPTTGGTGSIVQGGLNEYILLDFGAGHTTVSTIGLYFAAAPDSSNQYFTYSWLSSAPVAGATLPSVPLTSVSQTPSPGAYSSAGVYTFNMSTGFGGGQYLLLGATNHSNVSYLESAFRVNNVTYTTVPDGASTLALMGAAIATLGLASRRRRA